MVRIGIIKKHNLDASSLEKVLASFDCKWKLLNKSDSFIPDFIISYGGDGTVLFAMKFAVKFDVPLYAVGAGNINFLASGNLKDLEKEMPQLLERNVEYIYRSLLEVSFDNEKQVVLNDVVMTASMPSNMVKIDMFVDEKFVTCYKADGVIISTPTGSTAYNLSVGGVIVEPTIEAVSITPISSQLSHHKSMVVSKEHMIVLQSEDDVTVVFDGNKREQTQKIKISLSDSKLKLVMPKGKTYFDVIGEKFCWKNENL